ncbi:hypothetical protein [Haliscomenobacter sp.]|uniref:hypothetical protein n=1 Tax=Haliscomenobacter sp. TaxID=2717303 RepID=UPI003BAD7AAF
MEKQLKLKNTITDISKREKKKNRSCFFEGCNEKVINSHLLQRNGILDQLAVDHHLYILGMVDAFQIKRPSDNMLQFQKMGIREGMTLQLFCNKHDTEIFKPIESEGCNYYDYKTQLLFSYRSVCGELRKKQIQADIHGAIVNNTMIRAEMLPQSLERIEDFLYGFMLGIQDLEWYKKEIENDLYGDEQSPRFSFITVETPNLDVCTSSIFSPVDYVMDDSNKEDSLDSIVLNIFPKNQKNIVICGYHNQHKNDWIIEFTNSWNTLTDDELQKRVSNILIKRCETWAISPRLYDELSPEKRNLILLEFQADVMSHDQNLNTEINIFRN